MGWQGSCVTSVATRRLDLLEGLDVGIGDDLQTLSIGSVAEGVGERVETITIVILQRPQFGHGVAPALRARAPVTG